MLIRTEANFCTMGIRGVLQSDEMKIFLTLFFTYIIFANYVGWNEESRLDLTLAMVNDRTLTIDNYHLNTGDKAFFNGHFYTDKSLGSSLLAAPIYVAYSALFGRMECQGADNFCKETPAFFTLIFVVVIFTSALYTALTAALLYRFLWHFTERRTTRLLITYAFGLSTVAFSYGTVFYGHGSSNFFIFLAFYLAFLSHKSGKNLFLFSGLSAGAAFLVGPETIALVMGLCVFVLLGKPGLKKALLFLIGLSAVAVIFLAYNHAILGTHVHLAYMYVFDDESRTGEPFSPSEAFMSYIRPQPVGPWAGFPPKLFSSAYRGVLLRVLFYPYRGMFFYNPVLLFGAVGLLFSKRHTQLKWSLILGFMLLLLVQTRCFIVWWGGATVGAHLLTSMIPFLCLFMATPFKNPSRRRRALFFILLAVSSLFMLSCLRRWEMDILVPLESSTSLFGAVEKHYQDYAYEYEHFLPVGWPLFTYYLPGLLREGPESVLLKFIGFPIPPWINLALCMAFFLLVWNKPAARSIRRLLSLFPLRSRRQIRKHE